MKLKKVKNIKSPKKLQVPILSNTKFDDLLSYKGGLTPATSYGIYGDAGSGKSSVAFYISGKIAKTSLRVLNIQCEMEEPDIEEYSTRIEMGEVVYLDLLNSKNPKKEIEEKLALGWDVVTIDSINELMESIMIQNNEKRYVVEKYLLQLFTKHKKGDNKKGKFTSFFIVFQITKGGNYKGNKRIEHMLTGMFRIVKGEGNNCSRYITAIKNRKGETDKPLYFNFSNEGKLIFDTKLNGRQQSLEKTVEKNTSVSSQAVETFDDWISDSSTQDSEILEVVDTTSKKAGEFDVILAVAGGSKLAVVKLVKEFTGLGLKEAKDIVDSAPKAVKEGVAKDEAEALKTELEKLGAEVELRQFYGSTSFLTDYIN